MKTLISITIALFLVGCGSTDTENEKVTLTPGPEKVSNIGQNVNGLGYYDNKTIFGSHRIVGIKALYEIVNGEVDTNNGNYQRFGESAELMINSDWKIVGDYGVSEDGTVLKQYWDLSEANVVLEYIEPLTDSCDLVLNNRDYFAFCVLN